MLGFFKKKGDPEHRVAAEHTNLPLSTHLTRMLAEEIPLLDSKDRVRVYQILKDYEGPTITEQSNLPQEIKDMLDLD